MREISLKACVAREIARNQRVKWDSDPPPPLPPTMQGSTFSSVILRP